MCIRDRTISFLLSLLFKLIYDIFVYIQKSRLFEWQFIGYFFVIVRHSSIELFSLKSALENERWSIESLYYLWSCGLFEDMISEICHLKDLMWYVLTEFLKIVDMIVIIGDISIFYSNYTFTERFHAYSWITEEPDFFISWWEHKNFNRIEIL